MGPNILRIMPSKPQFHCTKWDALVSTVPSGGFYKSICPSVSMQSWYERRVWFSVTIILYGRLYYRAKGTHVVCRAQHVWHWNLSLFRYWLQYNGTWWEWKSGLLLHGCHSHHSKSRIPGWQSSTLLLLRSIIVNNIIRVMYHNILF